MGKFFDTRIRELVFLIIFGSFVVHTVNLNQFGLGKKEQASHKLTLKILSEKDKNDNDGKKEKLSKTDEIKLEKLEGADVPKAHKKKTKKPKVQKLPKIVNGKIHYPKKQKPKKKQAKSPKKSHTPKKVHLKNISKKMSNKIQKKANKFNTPKASDDAEPYIVNTKKPQTKKKKVMNKYKKSVKKAIKKKIVTKHQVKSITKTIKKQQQKIKKQKANTEKKRLKETKKKYTEQIKELEHPKKTLKKQLITQNIPFVDQELKQLEHPHENPYKAATLMMSKEQKNIQKKINKNSPSKKNKQCLQNLYRCLELCRSMMPNFLKICHKSCKIQWKCQGAKNVWVKVNTEIRMKEKKEKKHQEKIKKAKI